MEDRLADLKAAVSSRHGGTSELLPSSVSAVFEARNDDRTDLGAFEAQFDKKGAGDPTESAFMAEYLSQINVIKASMADIRTAEHTMRQLKQGIAQVATSEAEKDLAAQIQALMTKNGRNIMSTKTALESLKRENDLFIAKNPSSSEGKIRENMHAALIRKFREMLTDCQTLQTEYKQSVRDKIERQIRIVAPEASDYEIQEIIQTSDPTVAQQHIFAKITGAHESLSYAYRDIQDKHRDVKRLEESVQQLHQMFVDLATLVDQQGEMLDQIDYNVQNAADYTEKAEKDLVVAQKIQSKRKKWGCYISCCLIFLVVVAILPVLVYFT